MRNRPTTPECHHAAHRWHALTTLTTMLCALAATASADISGFERAALVDLYLATNGASWTYNYNWLDDPGTECYWRGVACDNEHIEVRGLNLAMNNLVGTLPGSLVNLSPFSGGGAIISYNALYPADGQVYNWLNWYSYDRDETQTIAPDNVAVTLTGDHTLWLGWDPVTYSGDAGGYEVLVSPAGAGTWSSAGWTSSKTVTKFPVTGLSPNTPYDMVVTTFTDPHAHNQNPVVSEPSELAVVGTASGGCAQPSITVEWGPPITPSVAGSFTSYLWSTGKTAAHITVDPPSPQWYWVQVTAAGSCDETAAVLIDPSAPIFADGFESGDTSAWSAP